MPSHNKKQPVQMVRKRQKRGRIYLIALVVIVILGIGLYVYAASLPPGPPDFNISAPTGITIHAGTPTSSVINVTAVNRFNGIVHLTATTSAGLTVSFNPQDITGSGTSTMTLSSNENGTYTLAVKGTSGTLTHTVSPRVATPIYATLTTTNGTIVVELYRAQTPLTVTNFVNLAQSHFYDNLVWHRLSNNPPVIQTGDPLTRYGNTSRSTWGTGGSSQTVPLEIDNSLHNNLGFLGMARGSDLNSGTSQFYINMANNNDLDGRYTVFGRVIAGMGTANILWHTPISTSYAEQPAYPIFLDSVVISPYQ